MTIFDYMSPASYGITNAFSFDDTASVSSSLTFNLTFYPKRKPWLFQVGYRTTPGPGALAVASPDESYASKLVS
jgi:hypothetical protein